MRDLLKVCVLAAGLLAAASPANAALVTHNLLGEVLEGRLDGTTATGSFSYDSSVVTGTGAEFVTPLQGLQVEFTFLGHTYTASDDRDFPSFPELGLVDGIPVFLDFLVVNGDGVGAEVPGVGVLGFALFPLAPLAGGFFAEISVGIPEPGSLVLLLAGGVALMARRRSHRRI